MINAMRKRGQATVFAIIGIVILIIVALFFFLRNEFGFFVAPTSFLSDKAKPIEDNLKGCINQAVSNNLNYFGKQGGDFGPTRYVLYESNNVKYYCTNIPNDEKCLNVMPSLDEMIAALNSKIQDDVNDCVDKSLVESGFGYKIEAGKITINTLASGPSLIVKAHYNVKIFKDENKFSVRDITLSYDAPLEDIYSVAVDIVNAEARVGFFEQLLYMLNKKGQFIINLDKPYPDKIYKIHKKNSNFEFWLAIEGERNI